MVHRRRASPLHAARAPVASLWCLCVSGAALGIRHPLVLGALLAAVLAAAAGARVGRDVARAAALAVPFGVLCAGVNALVVRDGLTVLFRFGTVPVLGSLDMTLEALVAGAVIGLQAVIVIACFALHSAAVDPDQLLRALRRVSFRTALTGALATRMVPVLARDGRRIAEAQRCRPGRPPSRAAIVRAVAANALDRAVDVAATLEVRGYGAARAARREARPWSRHDLGFAVSAIAVAAVAVVIIAAGLAPFESRVRVEMPIRGATVPAAGLLLAAMLAPFLDRRGVAPA